MIVASHPHTHARSRLPPFDRLVETYPAAQTVTAVKQLIGGGADDTRAPPGPQQWLGGANGDTCTLRMSRAFNYSGSPIPHGFPGLRTVKGRDHLNYAFAVREFEAWVRRNLGPADITVSGKPVARDKFLGHKGLIIFDIVFGPNADGSRALGHADLWDGKTFYDEINGISGAGDFDFFRRADRVSLWLTDGKATLSH